MRWALKRLLVMCVVLTALLSLVWANEESNDEDFTKTLEEVAQQPIYWLCRSAGDVRTLRIEAKKSYCTTKYTKMGAERVVRTSRNIKDCYSVFSNIRRNLENATYECKDISGSRISSSR